MINTIYKPIKVTLASALTFVKVPKDFIDSKLSGLAPWYQMNLGVYKLNLISDPNILNYVLKENEINYTKSKVYWHELKRMVGPSVGSLEGDDWKLLRKLESVHFTPKVAQQLMPNYLKYLDQFLNNWKSNNTSFNLLESFAVLNITFILKTLFNMEEASRGEKIAEYIADGEFIIAHRSKFPWRPYTAWLNGMNLRYKKHVKYFHAYAKESVRLFKESPKTPSLIDSLLKDDQLKFDKIDLLRNEIIVHLGASTETTAVAESWILILLARNPEKLKILKDEIRQIDTELIGVKHIERLKYTTAVVYETLRLFPPSHAIVRDAIKEDTVLGVKVKSGEVMFISSYAMHRNPTYWNNPQDFIPERFIGANINKMDHFVPFGAGKHICIGQHIALPMLTLAISNFINRFEYNIENLDKIHGIALSTLKPNIPVQMKLKTRKL